MPLSRIGIHCRVERAYIKWDCLEEVICKTSKITLLDAKVNRGLDALQISMETPKFAVASIFIKLHKIIVSGQLLSNGYLQLILKTNEYWSNKSNFGVSMNKYPKCLLILSWLQTKDPRSGSNTTADFGSLNTYCILSVKTHELYFWSRCGLSVSHFVRRI